MTAAATDSVGSVVAVWRYPVKSMMGEELNASDVTERGLMGDRAYALIDQQTGKVVSAKNPRKWRNMFAFRAVYERPPAAGRPLPAVRITLPAGTEVRSDEPGVHERISEVVGRSVRLEAAVPQLPRAEGYWPNESWLEHPDKDFEFPLPEGTFFDLAAVHLITTATLDSLRALELGSRFEARRFRPNLVIEAADGATGFVEEAWIGRTLALGADVKLRVTGPCPRCVMTTLAQSDLPRDAAILRTAVEHNHSHVGVYASLVRSGRLRRDDTARLE